MRIDIASLRGRSKHCPTTPSLSHTYLSSTERVVHSQDPPWPESRKRTCAHPLFCRWGDPLEDGDSQGAVQTPVTLPGPIMNVACPHTC